jgi:hypothetical protein
MARDDDTTQAGPNACKAKQTGRKAGNSKGACAPGIEISV